MSESPDEFRFTAALWEWSAQGGWFFVTLPLDVSAEIRETPRMPRGFGSVRVEARIGGSTWRTSIFPDSSRDSYVLPIKKAIRTTEGIEAADEVDVQVQLLE